MFEKRKKNNLFGRYMAVHYSFALNGIGGTTAVAIMVRLDRGGGDDVQTMPIIIAIGRDYGGISPPNARNLTTCVRHV
jgi:hypothetical protein